jgi:hypothetical protein
VRGTQLPAPAVANETRGFKGLKQAIKLEFKMKQLDKVAHLRSTKLSPTLLINKGDRAL